MAKGGSQAALAEQKKSRKQANAFNARALKAQNAQFEKTFKAQQAQNESMMRMARIAPSASETSRDMLSAANEIARAAASRTGFSKFRFAA